MSEKSERQAEAIARYMEALFVEELSGPDKALATKIKVLQADPEFTELSVDIAHQYLRHGEIENAIGILKEAAKASKDNPVPLLVLAAIHLRQSHQNDIAEKYALKAQELTPQDPAPYETLWEIYRATNQPQKIEALFNKVMAQNVSKASFWVELAELRTREGPGNNALPSESLVSGIQALLERAGKLAGNDASMLVRIADCHAYCAKFRDAVDYYKRALDRKANILGVKEKMAACRMKLGDNSEAIVLLEDIVRANPLDLSAYDQLARLQLNAKNIPQALTNLKQGLLLAPSDPLRYADVIRCSFETGDFIGALSFANDAEKRFPTHLPFTLYRAIALKETGKFEEAVQVFELTRDKASISSPSVLDSDFYFMYGAALDQAGHREQAISPLRKSIELDPAKAPRAYNYLSYMWAEKNENLDEALALVRKALESDPDNGAYLDTLGWVYFRQGKWHQALGELLRAASQLPEPDPVVFDHIGDTYDKLGKSAEAVLYWQKALHEKPDDKEIAKKLDKHSSRLARQPEPTTNPSKSN